MYTLFILKIIRGKAPSTSSYHELLGIEKKLNYKTKSIKLHQLKKIRRKN